MAADSTRVLMTVHELCSRVSQPANSGIVAWLPHRRAMCFRRRVARVLAAARARSLRPVIGATIGATRRWSVRTLDGHAAATRTSRSALLESGHRHPPTNRGSSSAVAYSSSQQMARASTTPSARGCARSGSFSNPQSEPVPQDDAVFVMPARVDQEIRRGCWMGGRYM